jgi:hypothetical protein
MWLNAQPAYRFKAGVMIGFQILSVLLILVVEYANDPAWVRPTLPVLLDGDQFGHVVHLHGAVTHEGVHRTVGMGELGADGVGHRCTHGGQASRQRC